MPALLQLNQFSAQTEILTEICVISVQNRRFGSTSLELEEVLVGSEQVQVARVEQISFLTNLYTSAKLALIGLSIRKFFTENNLEKHSTK